jgi:hypothetical protein
MALVRKGSRPIVVDDVTYRWRIRRRPTYAQGLGWKPLSYAVEQADTPGAILVVTTDLSHPNNWLNIAAKAVLPTDVTIAIRAARTQGWTPDKPGSPFLLDLARDRTPVD